VDALEPRIQRLETTVAALQDTQALEDRVAERVSDRLESKVTAEAQRLATAQRRESATAVMSAAQHAFRAAAPVATPSVVRGSWLVIDLIVEVAAILRMFFDYTYKVGWPTRILTLVLVPAILTSRLWFPGTSIWLVGEVIVKLVDLALAFILYKALSREAQNYLQTRS
jgi:hypothetical protein